MTILPRVLQELRDRELHHVLLTGGGIFPPEDIEALRSAGVGELFEPGDPMQKFVDYIRTEVARRRSARESAESRGAAK
jgi:methylmalonyl-CoA mutase C-terminal domain/subunit